VTDEVRVGEWNAHCSLGEDDKGKFVIFHSRGGDTTPSGEKRNHQYADGLETILCRLAGLNGRVTDALVDSGPARKLEEKERRLHLEDSRFVYPIRLGGIGRVKDDFKDLRLSMGKAQIPVGQANPGPNPKGNSTKKIRIYIDTADDVGLDELERVLGQREGRSDVPQESDQDEVAQVSNLWTRESTELFQREVPWTVNELLDLLAKSPERRFQALELVKLLGLNNRHVLNGILANLTLAAKRAGISQELEGSWFVSWTNHPNHPMEYWLSQERAEWWSGRKSTKAQESESAGEDTGHSVSSHPDAPDDDITQRQTSARKVRAGQPIFRRNLLRAYGEKCSISGTGPKEVLEAVHIIPHAESGINALDNGLLLRADLHNLFDDGLLRINPDSLIVELSSELRSTDYWELNGVQLRDRSDGSQQGREFLKQRWAEGTS